MQLIQELMALAESAAPSYLEQEDADSFKSTSSLNKGAWGDTLNTVAKMLHTQVNKLEYAFSHEVDSNSHKDFPHDHDELKTDANGKTWFTLSKDTQAVQVVRATGQNHSDQFITYFRRIHSPLKKK